MRELVIQIGSQGPRARLRPLPPEAQWLDAFLARLLAQAPAERFADASEALAALREHVARRPARAARVPRRPAAPPAITPRRSGAPILALAAAFAVTGGLCLRREPAPAPAAPATLATPAPSPSPSPSPLPVRPAATAFLKAFETMAWIDLIDELRDGFRNGAPDAASRQALRSRWKTRIAALFGTTSRRAAAEDLVRVLPWVATDTALPVAERAALLRQVAFVSDVRALLEEAHPTDWPLPGVDRLMPGVWPGRTLPAGLTRLCEIDVPPPRAFNTVELDLASVTGGVSDLRWDHAIAPPLPIRRPLKRAYLAYTVTGSSPAGKLVIRLAPDIQGRLAHEAAIIRGGPKGVTTSGVVRVDERPLNDVRTAISIHFEYYSVIHLGTNMRLERLALYGEEK